MTTIFETLDSNYILFENQQINIIIDNNDKLWFNANDLTTALGYGRQKRMIRFHVENKNKSQLQHINHNHNINKHPQSIYISETGLYTLLIKSNKPNAKKFTAWITEEVLPSLRKYGYYKMKTKYEQDKTGLLQQIKYLEKQTKTMEDNLKKDKYPNGALFYIIDYSDDNTSLPGIYRLGMTKNLKIRKQVYDTHTLNKKKVLHYEVVEDPVRLEYCMRSMLYKYRYRNNKDFYVCSLAVLKRALKKCSDTLKSMNTQTGGGLPKNDTMVKLKNKITHLDKTINKYNKLIDL
jgi:prophage antirepressor-like protein